MQAKLTSFKAAARLQLRTCLADHLHLPLISITIEGIKSGQTSSKPAAHCQQEGTVTKACDKTIAAEQGLADSRPGAVAAAAGHAAVQPSAVQASPSGVIVAVHIQLGGAQVQGRHLAAALQTAPHTLLTDEGMSAALGPLHAGSVQAEVVDVTPGLALDSSSTRQADSVAPAQEAKPPSRDLIEVSTSCCSNGRAFKCQAIGTCTPACTCLKLSVVASPSFTHFEQLRSCQTQACRGHSQHSCSCRFLFVFWF